MSGSRSAMAGRPVARRLAARPLAAVLVVAAVTAACDGDAADDPFARMIEQPRYDTYEAGAFFDDGKVLRRPPTGTVPWSRTATEGALTGATSEIPMSLTPELLAGGRERYGIYCAPCHGAQGFGDGSVALHMPPELRPPPLRGPDAHPHSAAELFEHVRTGPGRMPSYASELSEPETWAVVAWVQALRTGAEVAPRTGSPP